MSKVKEVISELSKMFKDKKLFWEGHQPTDKITTDPPKETGTGLPNFEYIPPPPQVTPNIYIKSTKVPQLSDIKTNTSSKEELENLKQEFKEKYSGPNTTIELQGFYVAHDKGIKPIPKEPVIKWMQDKGLLISKQEFIGLGFEYYERLDIYEFTLIDEGELKIEITCYLGNHLILGITDNGNYASALIKTPHTYKAIKKRIKHIKKAFGI